jgi:arylsulfatase
LAGPAGCTAVPEAHGPARGLRADPFERPEHEAGEYDKWRVEHAFVLVPAQDFVAQHLQTYVAYPPRQKPGSFSLDQVLAKLQEAGGSGKR